MHEAAHWISDYSSQHICTAAQLCEYGRPVDSDSISDFERFRALQNLSTDNSCGLALSIRLPERPGPHSGGYTQALLTEASLMYRHLPGKLRLQQLQVQGNPALLTPAQLKQLFDGLRKHFSLPANNFAWFGIEIQPDEADNSVERRTQGVGRAVMPTEKPTRKLAALCHRLVARADKFFIGQDRMGLLC